MLLPDGDLWASFERALNIRGKHSFAASWTKGHVTMEAMRDNPTLIYNAIQNGIVDGAAGAGATTAGRAAQHQLLDYYARKQAACIQLMRAIIARLVRVSAEVHRRRDEHRKAARSSGAIKYVDAPPEPESPSSSITCCIVLHQFKATFSKQLGS